MPVGNTLPLEWPVLKSPFLPCPLSYAPSFQLKGHVFDVTRGVDAPSPVYENLFRTGDILDFQPSCSCAPFHISSL